MTYLRAALVEQGIPIPPQIKSRDEVVAWALGYHLRDCVIDRRTNGVTLKRIEQMLDDGKGGGALVMLYRVHNFLKPDLDKEIKAKAALASVKNFFDNLSALLSSRRVVWWLRGAAGAIMFYVALRTGGIDEAMKWAHFLKALIID